MKNNLDRVKEFKRVLETEGRSILDCADRLSADPGQIGKAVELCCKALDSGGKIVVTGVGKSGKVGQKIAATLSSTGSLSVFLHPTEGLHGDLGIVSENDVILALSYTGNTEELIKLVPSFKNRGVPLIGLGGNRDSQLAHASEAWLDGSVAEEACPINLAPTSSSTLALALGDALAVTLMRARGFNEDTFARNHPGGSIGKKLNLKVSDLMIEKSRVGVLGPEAGIEEIVSTFTETRQGGVLVEKGGQFMGLIVDGDIRRAVAQKDRFFSLTAKDLMNAKPVSVSPSELASEALDKMENRKHQIMVLPVLDEDRQCRGLIRLHDIVRAF